MASTNRINIESNKVSNTKLYVPEVERYTSTSTAVSTAAEDACISSSVSNISDSNNSSEHKELSDTEIIDDVDMPNNADDAKALLHKLFNAYPHLKTEMTTQFKNEEKVEEDIKETVELDKVDERSDDRLILFPIRCQEAWDLYKKHQSTFWKAEQLVWDRDIVEWKTMSKDMKFYLKHVLAFFASSDAIVNENLMEHFVKEVIMPEMRQFYAIQMCMEAIHSETYSLSIQTLVKNKKEQNTLFNAIKTMPAVREKAKWAQKWSHGSSRFGLRVIAMMCVEGIFFSGSFCALYWLKKQGLMPALSLSNEWISRDEGLHCDASVLKHKLLSNAETNTWLTGFKEEPASSSEIKEIVKDAVRIEKMFVSKSLPVSLIGMNADLMCEHIESVADFWLAQLGENAIYHTPSPFEWMDLIKLQGKTNFFEKRVSEYAQAGVGAKTVSKEETEAAFTGDLDF